MSAAKEQGITEVEDSDDFDDEDAFVDAIDSDEEVLAAIAVKKKQGKIREDAQNFKPIEDLSDDFRMPDAHKDGGFPMNDPAVLAKFRNAFKDVLKQIGRSIFSGKFNLGSVSFPIKCMSDKSILYLIATMGIHAPIYMTRAALETDPVERMKYVLIESLSFVYPCHVFDKPLNPILGETLQAGLEDGSSIFLEQICHHPPISYVLTEGPDQLYRWSGYSSFSSRVHMNSVDLDVVGGKTITFKDGGRITYTPHQDKFLNSLWGTLIHLVTGHCTFEDKQNGVTAEYTIGGAKGHGKDYFVGEIKKDGKVVSKLFGTYMGYIEFDGVRYFDIRRADSFKVVDKELDECLSSDWRKRTDSMSLREGDVEQAQVNKDAQENL